MRTTELLIAYNALLLARTVMSKFGIDTVTLDCIDYAIREVEKRIDK